MTMNNVTKPRDGVRACLRRDVLSGHNKVALVLAILVVHHHDELCDQNLVSPRFAQKITPPNDNLKTQSDMMQPSPG